MPAPALVFTHRPDGAPTPQAVAGEAPRLDKAGQGLGEGCSSGSRAPTSAQACRGSLQRVQCGRHVVRLSWNQRFNGSIGP